jgi:hypothetical protein
LKNCEGVVAPPPKPGTGGCAVKLVRSRAASVVADCGRISPPSLTAGSRKWAADRSTTNRGSAEPSGMDGRRNAGGSAAWTGFE